MSGFENHSKAYPVYKTNVAPTSDAYKSNLKSWDGVLQRYEEGLDWAVGEGKMNHIVSVSYFGCPTFTTFCNVCAGEVQGLILSPQETP